MLNQFTTAQYVDTVRAAFRTPYACCCRHGTMCVDQLIREEVSDLYELSIEIMSVICPAHWNHNLPSASA